MEKSIDHEAILNPDLYNLMYVLLLMYKSYCSNEMQ